MLDLICFIYYLLAFRVFTDAFCPHRRIPLLPCTHFPPSPSDANLATRAKLSHWVLVLAGLHSHVFFNNVRGACLRFFLCLTVCYMYDPEIPESKDLLWRYGLGYTRVVITYCFKPNDYIECTLHNGTSASFKVHGVPKSPKKHARKSSGDPEPESSSKVCERRVSQNGWPDTRAGAIGLNFLPTGWRRFVTSCHVYAYRDGRVSRYVQGESYWTRNGESPR